jgi:hypothetical protein
MRFLHRLACGPSEQHSAQSAHNPKHSWLLRSASMKGIAYALAQIFTIDLHKITSASHPLLCGKASRGPYRDA